MILYDDTTNLSLFIAKTMFDMKFAFTKCLVVVVFDVKHKHNLGFYTRTFSLSCELMIIANLVMKHLKEQR